MMLRKDERAGSVSETARLICRQIRHAENARFLRRMPGFELKREMPSEIVDLLCRLQEVESASSR